MFENTEVWIKSLLAIGVGFAVSFAATPIVKAFAQKVGAMDVPGDARRIHDHPIPRMGGLAIFLGFIISVILFGEITREIQGILLGVILIVSVGAIDDIISLKWWVKLLSQLLAAVIAVCFGVTIKVFMNPNLYAGSEFITLGILSMPITILWIVGMTNSVNLIDGLDGLAVGVSAIASVTMFVVAIMVAEPNVAVILAALAGACVGFMPYNFNPAKIFMGDTGSLLLGYVLATVSVVGLFKFYAVVTFIVPIMALAVPFTDTVCSFFRRLIKGQNPMAPDRGHVHHRLIDMGLSQKQAVAVLYAISAILGLYAVVIVTRGELRFWLLVAAVVPAVLVGKFIMKTVHTAKEEQHTAEENAGVPEELRGAENSAAEKTEG